MFFFLATSIGRFELTHPSMNVSFFIFFAVRIPGMAIEASMASYIERLSLCVKIFFSPFLMLVAIIFRGILASDIFLFLKISFKNVFAFLYSILPCKYFSSNKSLVLSPSIFSLIVSDVFPIAYSAPITLPMEVPIISEGRKLFSSRNSIVPMCARPKEDPPDRIREKGFVCSCFFVKNICFDII